MNKTRQEAVRALSELLESTKTIFPATTASAAAPGQFITFTVALAGGMQTLRGEALSAIVPGNIAVLKLETGQWCAIDSKLVQSVDSTVLTRRHAKIQPPVDAGHCPYLVMQEDNGNVGQRRFYLIQGPRHTLVTAIPKRIPYCPPRLPNDQDPPLPSGFFPGYFIYYFYASTTSQDLFQGVMDQAGFDAVPFGLTSYFSGEMNEWESGRVSTDGTPYTVSLAYPPLGFLVYNSFGMYGVNFAPFATSLDDGLAQLAAANQRMDFSLWNAYAINSSSGAVLDTIAIEVVVTLIKGIPNAAGGFDPPQSPPGNPSGPRQNVNQDYNGPGQDVFGNVTQLLNGDHPWKRSSVRVEPPEPPLDPNNPNDPRNTARDNTYVARMCATARDIYITIADQPKCFPQSGVGRVQHFRVPVGRSTIEVLPAPVQGDWRGMQQFVYPATLFQIESDPCISSNVAKVNVNLFNNYAIELLPDPQGRKLRITADSQSYFAVRKTFEFSTVNPACTLIGGRRQKLRFPPANYPGLRTLREEIVAIAPFI